MSNPSEHVSLHRGVTPLLISFPHVGSDIPNEYRSRFVDRALATEDTDWHVDRLFDFAKSLGASLLIPSLSRYIVDLNRPPDNKPMYPGQNNTELCPTRFFTGDPIYKPGEAPDEAEVADRVERFWKPYHEALQAELKRIHSLHGHAVLFDAHSIKGTLPWLFAGDLPDMNVGTASATSCDRVLRAAVESVFSHQTRFSWIMDGRFKGGYITRRYGEPKNQIHAVQLEMSWRSYMREDPPYAWDQERAARLHPLLHELVTTLSAWVPG
jgi:N-formylglutamate deformylase